ncbi:MAG: hypothetical protein CO066_06080 [Comamonadaceae bacterium CG_4_9_14_0_8_um_filter_60_18]|nr:MAG: hypothetical protein AUK52_07690 [Comamonadaceae bacterium CG2_30_60_41]PIW09882.1 MAG: hypothetical protein COW39_02475 [Comamonadaceae bacterium CG17_big_fil_post_rev_8_21_14_2_50_60_13]PJC14438.1 MAG: hypothetical protein CO066_06080 [Comamonadaceae bacterium CG_4_9_14_0_8_um_filter_60_18]
MRVAIAFVLTVHAVIHLMGFAKAFGYAALPELVIPISRPTGLPWLLATLLLLTAAVALWMAPNAFWILAAAGLVVSQAVIFTSWGDARYAAPTGEYAYVEFDGIEVTTGDSAPWPR